MKIAKVTLFFVSLSLMCSTVLGAENPKPDKSLEYKETPQGKLFLHAYYPVNWKASDQRPAVVFFFGGGWSGGSYLQFTRHADYLASRGMVAFCADYRIANKHKTPPKACVSDGKSAMRWIRSHAAQLGIDPEKILAGGGSAGGHVAAATATIAAFDEATEDTSVSCHPQALVLFNPVIDNSENGYGFGRVKEYWQEFSPMHNIKKAMPPTIFICGTKDKLIPVATGELFKQKIEAVGGRCDLHWYEGQSHGFFNRMYIETMHQVDSFLVSLGYLNGPATLGNAEPAATTADKTAVANKLDAQLFRAVKNDQLDKVTECLDGGANVNALDDSKNNVLIWAVDKKNLPMVKILVEFGADIHQKNKYGNNALAAAKRRKFTEIEQFLREQLE